MSRKLTATVDGETYEIPEIWIAGFCQTHRTRTTEDAVMYWHWQSQLAKADQAQNVAA